MLLSDACSLGTQLAEAYTSSTKHLMAAREHEQVQSFSHQHDHEWSDGNSAVQVASRL